MIIIIRVLLHIEIFEDFSDDRIDNYFCTVNADSEVHSEPSLHRKQVYDMCGRSGRGYPAILGFTRPTFTRLCMCDFDDSLDTQKIDCF